MKTFLDSKIFDKIKKTIKNLTGSFKVEPPMSSTDPDFSNQDMITGFSSWRDWIQLQLEGNSEDKQKYADYDLMDSEIPEISAALDVMSDFVIFADNVNKTSMFKVTARKNGKVVDEYRTAIESINQETNFKTELSGIIRDLCKYGDDVEELLKDMNSERIVQLRGIPVESFIMNINNGVVDKDFPIKQVNSAGNEIAKLPADKVLHFCLNSDRQKFLKYGKGVSKIEKARLIYRQLRLMEEGLMIRRLSTSNSNYGIIVDVGDLVADEALGYVERVKKSISRRKYIDPKTGRISYKFNPLSAMEDIVLPTRQGSGSNIIPLNKNSNGDAEIKDILYFQDKMIYAPGVPKVLIGKEQDMASKGTGDTQFVSFLRSIRKIQRMVTPTIQKFYNVSLRSRGLQNFDEIAVDWPWLSVLDEKIKYEIEQLRISIGQGLLNSAMIDDEFFYRNYMQMDDGEIEELKTRMDEEEKEAQAEFEAELARAKDMTNDPNADEEFATIDQPPKKSGGSSNKPTEDDEEDPQESFKRINRICETMSLDQKKEYLNQVYSEHVSQNSGDAPSFRRMMELTLENPEVRRNVFTVVELLKLKKELTNV